MKYLITGVAGFIGFHLAKKLLDGNVEIYGVDNLNSYYDPSLKNDRLKQLKSYKNFNFKKVDICDKNALKNIFEEFSPRKVVNFAAQPGVRYSLINPDAYIKTNLIGFHNVIELCKDFKVKGLIYASSSSVYGGNQKIPFSVTDKTMKPISLYGATKKSNELIAHSYSSVYGLHNTGLRFFTVYGSWYRPDMGLFIFIKKILNEEPITLFNNGDMYRDFTFIDDIISGTIAAIDKNYKFEIFNLGNCNSISLTNLIQIIEKNLNKKAKIKYEPLQSGDMISTSADIVHSVDKLGFKPKTNIEEGISSLIKWYKDYYNV